MQDLKTSQNLGEEMKKIAKNNVQQVQCMVRIIGYSRQTCYFFLRLSSLN